MNKNQNQQYIEITHKDAFGNDIAIGSKIYCMDNWGDDTFAGFIKGEVIGFTPEFVKIKVIKYSEYDDKTQWMKKDKIYRTPHRIFVTNDKF